MLWILIMAYNFLQWYFAIQARYDETNKCWTRGTVWKNQHCKYENEMDIEDL